MPFNPSDADDIIIIEIPTDIEDCDDDGDIDDLFFSTDDEQEELVRKRNNVPQGGTNKTPENDNVVAAKRIKLNNSDIEADAETDNESEAIVPDKNKANASGKKRDVSSYEVPELIIKTENSNDADSDAHTREGSEYLEEDSNDSTSVDEVKGVVPEKYLLFDDMLATVIGFDAQETPIVEFTPLTRDEVKHNLHKLPMECGICPAILKYSKIANHIKLHMTDENRYQCQHCNATHMNRQSAAAHARRHLGVRPFACQTCDNYFTTKNDLKLHHQRKHMKREFICEMCGKSYAQNTFLKRHILTIHEGVKEHICSYCPKSYHRRGNLKEHIDTVHMGQRKPLNCRFCGEFFRDSHKLAAHRKQEHLSKSHFQCVPCDVTFSDIQFFNAHKRSIQCRSNRRQIGSPTQDSEAMELITHENDCLQVEKQEWLEVDQNEEDIDDPKFSFDLPDALTVPVQLLSAKEELPELPPENEQLILVDHTPNEDNVLQGTTSELLHSAQFVDEGHIIYEEHEELQDNSDEQKPLILKIEPKSQQEMDDGDGDGDVVEYILV